MSNLLDLGGLHRWQSTMWTRPNESVVPNEQLDVSSVSPLSRAEIMLPQMGAKNKQTKRFFYPSSENKWYSSHRHIDHEVHVVIWWIRGHVFISSVQSHGVRSRTAEHTRKILALRTKSRTVRFLFSIVFPRKLCRCGVVPSSSADASKHSCLRTVAAEYWEFKARMLCRRAGHHTAVTCLILWFCSCTALQLISNII